MNSKAILLALTLTAAGPALAADQGAAVGTVNTVDAAKGTLNMTHDPIPALGWPAMTMDFGTAPGVPLAGLAKGSKVTFTVAKGNDGIFRIIEIKPAGK